MPDGLTEDRGHDVASCRWHGLFEDRKALRPDFFAGISSHARNVAAGVRQARDEPDGHRVAERRNDQDCADRCFELYSQAARERKDQIRFQGDHMAKWAAYLDLVLAGEIKEIGQRELNVVLIDRSPALVSTVTA